MLLSEDFSKITGKGHDVAPMVKLSVLLLTAMLLSSCLLLCFNMGKAAASSRTITVPDDFSTIQAAIDNASVGDTVFVKSGTYDISSGGRNIYLTVVNLYAGLTIDKPISLVGENCSNTIILGLLGPYSPGPGFTDRGISVESNDVLISGFTIVSDKTACYLVGDNITLSNNVVNSTGIAVSANGRITVSYNVIEGNRTGLIVDSGDLTISNNMIRYFNEGIVVRKSTGSIRIFNNTIANNSMGVCFSNAPVLFCYNNLVNCSKYSVYLGALPTFVTYDCPGTSENVNATYNYWGTTNQSVIANSIYDNKNASLLGTLYFKPFLTSTSQSATAQNLLIPTSTPLFTYTIAILSFQWFLITTTIAIIITLVVAVWASKKKS